MKKILLLVAVVLVLAGMFMGPFLKGCTSSEPTGATFLFKENLASKWGESIALSFESKDSDIEKVELIYNDSLLETFRTPKEKEEFQLNASFFGLGTRELTLKSYFKNGVVLTDTRLVRVLSDISPAKWTLKIVNTFEHNAKNFTQGLEFDGETLFESTGDPNHTGQTLLGPIDLKTGEHTKKIGLDANYFGEGITILNDKIYQLTYTQNKCFVYNKSTLILEKEFTYPGEGWGICNDGEFLYMSNGTERITKRDPKTFAVVETIEVCDTEGPIRNLNELEFVDGLLYANIWMTNAIVAIQPENGKVIAVMDGSELANKGQAGGDVLNGIAYNAKTNRFFFTGKYWNKMFEVEIVK